jgi:uncharacterized damage-inducible protein DinB
MRDYFLKLFAHEHWANAQLLTALRAVPEVPVRTRELVPHIFAAHQFMDKRAHSETVNFWEYDFFPKYSLDKCRELNEHYSAMWPEFLRALPDPMTEQRVNVLTQDGEPRSVVIVDLLTHLYTHSIHHRGQIAADLRAAELEPVATDYIIYCRTHP